MEDGANFTDKSTNILVGNFVDFLNHFVLNRIILITIQFDEGLQILRYMVIKFLTLYQRFCWSF